MVLEIILGIFALLVILLWWSGNLGKVGFLLKGFTSLFVQRQIQTLEGLEAAYTQAIEEMRIQRKQIAETYQNISGQRQLTEREIASLHEQIESATVNVDKFLVANDEEMALEWSETMSRLQGDLKTKIPLVLPLKAHEQNLEKMLKSVETSIKALEAEKHQELNKMKANLTITEVNNRMSQLGTSIDVRVLEVAKQGARAAEADALGATALREISSDSRMGQVIESTNRLNATSYLEKRKLALLANSPTKLLERKS